MLPLVPAGAWLGWGEGWLTAPPRVGSPDVVVVEGWIGFEGMAAAAAEVTLGRAEPPIAAAGGWGTGGWNTNRVNYAELAAQELERLGVPSDRIVVATATDVKIDRSHATAIAVRDALRAAGIAPRSVNVVTRGVHARRSRLVFARVFGDDVKVGAVGWVPRDQQGGHWWEQTERATDFFKESLAYPLELFFKMGQHRRRQDGEA